MNCLSCACWLPRTISMCVRISRKQMSKSGLHPLRWVVTLPMMGVAECKKQTGGWCHGRGWIMGSRDQETYCQLLRLHAYLPLSRLWARKDNVHETARVAKGFARDRVPC